MCFPLAELRFSRWMDRPITSGWARRSMMPARGWDSDAHLRVMCPQVQHGVGISSPQFSPHPSRAIQTLSQPKLGCGESAIDKKCGDASMIGIPR